MHPKRPRRIFYSRHQFGTRSFARLGLALLMLATAGCSDERSNDAAAPTSEAGRHAEAKREKPQSNAQQNAEADAPPAGAFGAGPAHPEAEAPSQPQQSERVASASGNYLIDYHTVPAPLPLNELFEVRGRVLDADGTPLGGEFELRVDAAMPDHGHGMNTQPRVELDGSGFVAQGMLFHMSGYWELYFDVTRDGVTERAQVAVELE